MSVRFFLDEKGAETSLYFDLFSISVSLCDFSRIQYSSCQRTLALCVCALFSCMVQAIYFFGIQSLFLAEISAENRKISTFNPPFWSEKFNTKYLVKNKFNLEVSILSWLTGQSQVYLQAESPLYLVSVTQANSESLAISYSNFHSSRPVVHCTPYKSRQYVTFIFAVP